MVAYHAALEELSDIVMTEGLDPRERAIILLPRKPEEAPGLVIWEVDVELDDDSEAVMWQEPIAPARVRVAQPEAGMPMAM